MQTDALLKQLGYTPNNALLDQMGRVIENTRKFERIDKHIVELHNVLQACGGFVALSNSDDFLKIKLEEVAPERKEEAREKISHFANKYKVEIEKSPGKETYYILGFKK